MAGLEQGRFCDFFLNETQVILLMPLRFEGCRERLRRAKVHRENIAALWNKAGKAEDLYEVIVGMDDDGTGCIWLKARHQPELISALSLELGEMLYQLRAALDGCIYQAAIFESKQNPPPDEHSLEFPVCISSKDFENQTFKIRPVVRQNVAHYTKEISFLLGVSSSVWDCRPIRRSAENGRRECGTGQRLCLDTRIQELWTPE